MFAALRVAVGVVGVLMLLAGLVGLAAGGSAVPGALWIAALGPSASSWRFSSGADTPSRFPAGNR